MPVWMNTYEYGMSAYVYIGDNMFFGSEGHGSSAPKKVLGFLLPATAPQGLSALSGSSTYGGWLRNPPPSWDG